MSLNKLGKALILAAFAAGMSGVVEATTVSGTGANTVDQFGDVLMVPDLEQLPAHSADESQKTSTLGADLADGGQQAIFEAYRDRWVNAVGAWPADASNYEDIFKGIYDKSNGSSGGTTGEEYYTLSYLVKSAAMRATMYNGLAWLDRHTAYVKGCHRFYYAAVTARRVWDFLDDYFKTTGADADSLVYTETGSLLKTANFDIPAYGWSSPHYTYDQFKDLGVRLKKKFYNARNVVVATGATRGNNRGEFLNDWLNASIEILESKNENIVTPTYLVQLLRNLTTSGTDDIATSDIVAATGTRYHTAEKLARIAELIATNSNYMSLLGQGTTLGGDETDEKYHAMAGVLRLATNENSDIYNGGDHIFGPETGTSRLHLILIFLALGGDTNMRYGHSATGNIETEFYTNAKDVDWTSNYKPRDVYTIDMESKYKFGNVWTNIPGGLSVKNAPVSSTPRNDETIF